MMTRLVVVQVGILVAVHIAFGADPPVRGTIDIKQEKYTLKHFSVFHTDPDVAGVDRICIVASSKPMDPAKVAALRQKDQPLRLTMFQPYIVVSYTRKGMPYDYRGWADNYNFQGEFIDGEMKIVGDKITGYARRKEQEQRNPDFRSDFDFRFDIPIPPSLDIARIAVSAASDEAPVAVATATADNNPLPGPSALSFPLSMDMNNLPGNFSVLVTQLGILRIDTRNGKTWILVPGAGDEAPKWDLITESSEPQLPTAPATNVPLPKTVDD